MYLLLSLSLSFSLSISLPFVVSVVPSVMVFVFVCSVLYLYLTSDRICWFAAFPLNFLSSAVDCRLCFTCCLLSFSILWFLSLSLIVFPCFCTSSFLCPYGFQDSRMCRLRVRLVEWLILLLSLLLFCRNCRLAWICSASFYSRWFAIEPISYIKDVDSLDGMGLGTSVFFFLFCWPLSI